MITLHVTSLLFVSSTPTTTTTTDYDTDDGNDKIIISTHHFKRVKDRTYLRRSFDNSGVL